MKKYMIFGIAAVSLICIGCGKRAEDKTTVPMYEVTISTEEIKEDILTRVDATEASTTEAKLNNDEDDDPDEENVTGSFKSMNVIYKNKYRVKYYAENTGHPSPESDFGTGYDIKNDLRKVYAFINYNGYTDSKIEDDYPNYDNMNDIKIGEKSFKYIIEGNKLILFYKVDDSFYVKVDVRCLSDLLAEEDINDNTAVLSFIDSGEMDIAIKFDVNIL